MGEEGKKPEAAEEKKMEEKKPEEEKKEGEEKKVEPDEKKEEESEKKTQEGEPTKDSKDESPPAAPEAPSPPPPPQEIVLKVYMHCEGCARKVRRCLKGFDGVDDVMTDCKSGKVVVKGEKADPLKVLARVQRKTHRQVVLLSPIPPPSQPLEKKAEEEKPKVEEKKVEPPVVVTVVLKVHMHCEACATEIKKRIMRMKGVESAESDLKGSQVTVKGVFEPQKLVDYVYKRTGKHAAIMKVDPPPPPPPEEAAAVAAAEGEKKEEAKKQEMDEGESKGEEGKEEKAKTDEEKKEGDAGKGEGEAAEKDCGGENGGGGGEEEVKVVEVRKIENPYHYYLYQPPRVAVPPMEMPPYAYPHAYPPQLFSDENPNACSIM
ncbi:Heavy metal-associated isoprenylated plant protein 7 [Hirschfeldia incana]|nr:Heavy metal-associated isoprenylated plant protein 7 [Hirschfeldia incana]